MFVIYGFEMVNIHKYAGKVITMFAGQRALCVETIGESSSIQTLGQRVRGGEFLQLLIWRRISSRDRLS